LNLLIGLEKEIVMRKRETERDRERRNGKESLKYKVGLE
jgi:hypothetical protein